MTAVFEHQPVLLAETLYGLQVRPDGNYLDGTFGRGGHGGEILRLLGPEGCLLAIDKDPLAVATGRAIDDPRFTIEQGSFADMTAMLERHGLAGKLDGVLLDLGVSSPQLDDPERGFSFQNNGPLDMRMDPAHSPSAAEWLAQAGADEIADVLWRYGDERLSRRIARVIVAARVEAPIKTTGRLASLVSSVAPRREKGKHPATRTFQAIRIHINGELDDLELGLDAAMAALRPGGRLAVISFHSLEDRMVKRFMRRQSKPGDDLPPDLPVRAVDLHASLRLIGRAVRASNEEVAVNPRSRSAVLRVGERLAA